MLGPPCEAESQPFHDVPFDIDVSGDVVAGLFDRVGWPEPGEHLRAEGCGAARPVGDAAIPIRIGLAGLDLVALVTILGAERDVERAGHSLDGDGTAHVEVADELIQLQRPGVEGRLVRWDPGP